MEDVCVEKKMSIASTVGANRPMENGEFRTFECATIENIDLPEKP